jgi:hypothetical protein
MQLYLANEIGFAGVQGECAGCGNISLKRFAKHPDAEQRSLTVLARYSIFARRFDDFGYVRKAAVGLGSCKPVIDRRRH